MPDVTVLQSISSLHYSVRIVFTTKFRSNHKLIIIMPLFVESYSSHVSRQGNRLPVITQECFLKSTVVCCNTATSSPPPPPLSLKRGDTTKGNKHEKILSLSFCLFPILSCLVIAYEWQVAYCSSRALDCISLTLLLLLLRPCMYT